jgi:hypothetical protein
VLDKRLRNKHVCKRMLTFHPSDMRTRITT